MPRKNRVQIIASVLLVFAGTEVFVLAPYLFEIAVLIDIGGLVVVMAALRSSVSVSMMQVHALLSVILKPIVVVSRIGEEVADFGNNISPNWYRRYFFVDRITTRSSAAVFALAVGVAVARFVVGIV